MNVPDFNLRRRAEPKLLPVDFWDTLFNRYFPVVSLTYLSSVFGIAFKESPGGQGLVEHIFGDPYPYDMALWVALWVSIPAVFWIFMRHSIRFAAYANIWYKVVAGTMALTALLSLLLFPEWDAVQGVRVFFVATIPVFMIQYLFFVRGGLPPKLAWPLTVAGLVFMLYGTLIV